MQETVRGPELRDWCQKVGLLERNQDFADKRQRGAALAKGRHKTDSDNYRGVGYRTDAKERGRFVELFNTQAEKGEGINSALVNVAIAKCHKKQAILDVEKAEKAGAIGTWPR